MKQKTETDAKGELSIGITTVKAGTKKGHDRQRETPKPHYKR
jgi:hypothetical protein